MLTALHRGVYRYSELKRFFNPASIAICGISTNPASIGARTRAHLRHFGGRIYLVNPKYGRIDEALCYPRVDAIEEKPDCVLIALPREAVEEAVMDCVRSGVGGVVIFASGYAETGKAERIALQERLAAISKETGLRIAGPNCVGFLNFSLRLAATFSRANIQLEIPDIPKVGLVSQSGAMGLGLSQAVQRGLALSHVLSPGNSCDVNIADCVAYLAEEPSCDAIACVFEGLKDPYQFIEAGRIAWEHDKPLIVTKLGIGERGAAAALSHTGSLAGSEAAYRAAFERTGIIVLEGIEGVLETAAFFSKAPRRASSAGVAVLSGSGGALISAMDCAERHGVSTPQPSDNTRLVLEKNVPEFGAAKNPCDMTAMGGNNPEVLPNCVRAMMSDDAYGAVVYPHLQNGLIAIKRELGIGNVASQFDKPLCIPFIGGWIGGLGVKEIEMHRNIAVFYSMDRCFSTLAEWNRRSARREQMDGGSPDRISPLSALTLSAKAIQGSGNNVLTEREAKIVLSHYGVAVVREVLVQSSVQAVVAARSMGFPVAMKVESPDLPHKTEAGVVSLGLKSEEDVKEAYGLIIARATKAIPTGQINGVLVQPMISGVEIMLGGRIDPLFGPLIVVGLGGILVEVLKDTAVGLAPVTKRQALEMLNSLKGKALLNGFRSFEPVDLHHLSQTIAAVSEFIADQKDMISELDVNPLICVGDRFTAVDALIVRKLR